MEQPLAGRVAVVTGADRPLGTGLALALAGAGAAVGLLGGGDDARLVADEVHRRGGWAVARPADLTTRVGVTGGCDDLVGLLGPLDVVVHAAVHPLAVEAVDAVDIDDHRWQVVWEDAMRASLFLLQAAHRHMAGRGGRVIFVTPTISLSGAARLVPYATTVEGQRLLAKSAARQWGAAGITVNCVAPAAVLAGVDPAAVGSMSLVAPALGRVGEPEGDLGPVVTFLAGAGSHFLTGATLAVDGGVWMAP